MTFTEKCCKFQVKTAIKSWTCYKKRKDRLGTSRENSVVSYWFSLLAWTFGCWTALSVLWRRCTDGTSRTTMDISPGLWCVIPQRLININFTKLTKTSCYGCSLLSPQRPRLNIEYFKAGSHLFLHEICVNYYFKYNLDHVSEKRSHASINTQKQAKLSHCTPYSVWYRHCSFCCALTLIYESLLDVFWHHIEIKTKRSKTWGCTCPTFPAFLTKGLMCSGLNRVKQCV